MRLVLAYLIFFSVTQAQTPWPEVRFVSVVQGLTLPVDLQFPPDGSGRMFAVEQRGRIRVFQNGSLLPTPALDISARIVSGGELGLLGLAFPPDFVNKRYFYVNYTERAPNLQTVVARFRFSADDPNRADPNSEERILTFDQPFTNHNGGGLAFGPDGYLYIGTGDGGSANDPQGNGQRRNTLLGKMLRIDTESGERPYRVPPDNPFVGNGEYRPEIWALGLRNPWRYSFDRETRDLWIADVGQGRREEVNFQPASSRGGENYGWNTMEGTLCLFGTNCNRTGLTLPVFEYTNYPASVTGGFVYRGSRWPAWRGTYFFADYIDGRFFALRRNGDVWEGRLLQTLGYNVSTFAQDEAGELYLVRYDRGEIFRLEGTAVQPAISNVVNTASGETGAVPGSIVTIFSRNLRAPGVTEATGFPLPLEMEGVNVLFDDVRAPVQAVANIEGLEVVRVQVPWEIAGRERAAVVITAGGQRSEVFNVPVLSVQPAVFRRDGNQVWAFDAVTGAEIPAAAPGQTIMLLASGLGAVANQPASGQAGQADPYSALSGNLELRIGGERANVIRAGLIPGTAGHYEVVVTVPQLPSGSAEVRLSVNGVAAPPAAIALQ